MADHTVTWDSTYEDDPSDLLQANVLGDRIRDTRRDVRERAEQEHYWEEDEEAQTDYGGLHKFPRVTKATADGDVKAAGHLVFITDEPLIGVSNGTTYDYYSQGYRLVGELVQCAYDVTSPPALYLAANGQEVSRTTYADLFAKIGTAWGVGDGSTTFNLPDMGMKVPSGYKASGIGDAVFKGSGTDDATLGGTYSGTGTKIYVVEVVQDDPRDPNTVKISSDGGATFGAPVDVDTSPVALGDGITMTWGATTGHVTGDRWYFLVDDAPQTVGSYSGKGVHQLVEDEIPTLAHSSNGSHSHSTPLREATGTGSSNERYRGGNDEDGQTVTINSAGSHVHDSHGNDGVHETRDRIAVVGWLIYAGA